MKTYKCVIIDDEPYAVKFLTNYVEALPNLSLLKSYTDPLEALADLSGAQSVDLVLLDIHMPILTGLDLSYKIRCKTNKLVFTTGYREYGYDAYEADADAYLLKPYTLSKFAATIGKLFPNNQSIIEPPLTEFFFVKNKNDGKKLIKVAFVDVVAVESKQNYILIHTISEGILTHLSLSEISKTLSLYSCFVQFQRSFIISKNHINYIYGNTIRMNTGLELTVGDYYRRDFAAFMAEKIIKAGRS